MSLHLLGLGVAGTWPAYLTVVDSAWVHRVVVLCGDVWTTVFGTEQPTFAKDAPPIGAYRTRPLDFGPLYEAARSKDHEEKQVM